MLTESDIQPYLPSSFYPIYIDYSDSLDENPILDLYLSGKPEMAQEEIYDSSLNEQEHITTMYEVDEIRESYLAYHEGYQWSDDDTELVCDMLYELTADYDPIQNLLNNTPPQFVYYRLDNETPIVETLPETSQASSGLAIWVYNDTDEDRLEGEKDRYDAVMGILNQYNFTPTGDNQEAISELINNGPYDWHEAVHLEVLGYEKVTDIMAGDTPYVLQVTNPYIVLIDPWNGSGHDVQIMGTLDLPVNKNQYFQLDDTRSYSWYDIAGPNPSAYQWEKLTKS